MKYFSGLFSGILALFSLFIGAVELWGYFNIPQEQLSNGWLILLTFMGLWLMYYVAVELSSLVEFRGLYQTVFETAPNTWFNIKNLLLTELDKVRSLHQKELELMEEKESFRKEYIGNISHELKTPLHTIQGFTDSLLDGGMNDPDILQKYLDRISASTERLISVVSDLDAISKIESGGLRLNQSLFDVVALVQNVFDMLEIKAKTHYMTLQWDKSYGPTQVYADKERMEQVFINLITNAILHAGDGKTVTVAIKGFGLSNMVRIIIEDNGIGLSSDHQKRIFERFYRVDSSRSRNKGGSGLGLSIVKHLLEAHHQNIHVESIPKRFTRFYFYLPTKNMRP